MLRQITRIHSKGSTIQSSLSAGFSLVELMVVVAIIGILAAFGISWQPNIKLASASRELYSNMQNAKLEAIKRNQKVVMVFNAVNCPGLPVSVPYPGGSYTAFVDDGAGGGVAGDGIQNGTEVTLFNTGLPSSVAICNQAFVGGKTVFLPTGMVTTIGSVTLNNDRNGSHMINLTVSGGIRIN